MSTVYRMYHTINDISFSADTKQLCIAHEAGYRLYDTDDLFKKQVPVKRMERAGDDENNYLIIRTHVNLMACVNQKETRRVHIRKVNKLNTQLVCSLMCVQSVVALEMNEERLVICLEDTIFTYSLPDVCHIHTIQGTDFNVTGVMDLTQNTGFSLLAYPEKADTGVIRLHDAGRGAPLMSIKAHATKVVCVKFNPQGTALATASCRGTVIKVFGVPGGELMYEFRRGISAARIQSLSFSPNSKLMCSLSATQTIHVYKLPSDHQTSAWSLATLSSYVPPQLSYSVTAPRSFTVGCIPHEADKKSCCVIEHNNLHYILVASDAGFIYVFKMWSEQEPLQLVAKHRIWSRRQAYPSPRQLMTTSSQREEGNDENAQR